MEQLPYSILVPGEVAHWLNQPDVSLSVKDQEDEDWKSSFLNLDCGLRIKKFHVRTGALRYANYLIKSIGKPDRYNLLVFGLNIQREDTIFRHWISSLTISIRMKWSYNLQAVAHGSILR